MNRDALVQRNRQLAEAFHSTPMRHHVRRTLLHALASVPFDPLYTRARRVLGVDSGPLHIAAAVGTPTVALFGAADPVEFAQWGDRKKHIILTSTIGCRPCRVLDWGDDSPENHPCMREITLGDVLEAARRVYYAN